MDYSRIDLRTVFSDGWKLFRSRTGELLVTSLVAGAVLTLSAGVLAGPMLAWLLLTTRRFSLNRPALPGETLFAVFRLQLIVAALAWVVMGFVARGLVAVVGPVPAALLCLLPFPAPFWATAFVAFRGDTAWEAYRSLWNRIRHEGFWIPYAASFAPILVCVSGAALGGIGAILTAPIGCCLFQKLYEQAFENEPDVEVVWE